MFLATTALNQFWDTDQELYFLSSGCLRYSERSNWESLKYEIMPNPWNNRQRFYEAAEYLEKSYERMLDRISDYLNRALEVFHGKRYWRIILGPWLYHYVQTIYDRYTLLADAFELHPTLETYTLDPQCFRVPRDMEEFTDLVCYDAYNLQLFSLLLQACHDKFPTKILDSKEGPKSVQSGATKKKWEYTVKSAGKFGLNLGQKAVGQVLGKTAAVYLCGMNMPQSQIWGIAGRTRMSAVPITFKNEWPFVVPEPVFNGLRNDLDTLDFSDEFEAALVRTLPHNFPSLYLEGFRLAEAKTVKRRPKSRPVLVSMTGWYFTEPFKFMAADGSENGCRLVAVQHGGTYGVGRLVPAELHELAISDSHMVWGWAADDVQSQHNLPSPKLSNLLTTQSNEPSGKKDGPILMVTTAHPRYLIRFQSFPVGGQWGDYLDLRFRFLESVPEQVRKEILLRPGTKDYGWDFRQRTLEAFPQVGFDDGAQFLSSLKACRMVVSDYSGTTYLESMLANVPTVMFWDPQQWEMRDEAGHYFDRLREVGVLWNSPEAAAAHTASISEDPWQWWGSEQVRQACKEFLDRFALGREDWARCWADALREEAAMGRAVIEDNASN